MAAERVQMTSRQDYTWHIDSYARNKKYYPNSSDFVFNLDTGNELRAVHQISVGSVELPTILNLVSCGNSRIYFSESFSLPPGTTVLLKCYNDTFAVDLPSSHNIITSATESDGVITITTAQNHGLIRGNAITITGSTVPDFTAIVQNVISPTVFTVRDTDASKYLNAFVTYRFSSNQALAKQITTLVNQSFTRCCINIEYTCNGPKITGPCEIVLPCDNLDPNSPSNIVYNRLFNKYGIQYASVPKILPGDRKSFLTHLYQAFNALYFPGPGSANTLFTLETASGTTPIIVPNGNYTLSSLVSILNSTYSGAGYTFTLINNGRCLSTQCYDCCLIQVSRTDSLPFNMIAITDRGRSLGFPSFDQYGLQMYNSTCCISCCFPNKNGLLVPDICSDSDKLQLCLTGDNINIFPSNVQTGTGEFITVTLEYNSNEFFNNQSFITLINTGQSFPVVSFTDNTVTILVNADTYAAISNLTFTKKVFPGFSLYFCSNFPCLLNPEILGFPNDIFTTNGYCLCAPYNINLEPSRYVLIQGYVNGNPGSLISAHKNAEGSIIKDVLAKVVIFCSGRVDRIYPMQMTFATSITVDQIHFRLLDSHHNLLNLEGREWSITLVMTTL